MSYDLRGPSYFRAIPPSLPPRIALFRITLFLRFLSFVSLTHAPWN